MGFAIPAFIKIAEYEMAKWTSIQRVDIGRLCDEMGGILGSIDSRRFGSTGIFVGFRSGSLAHYWNEVY